MRRKSHELRLFGSGLAIGIAVPGRGNFSRADDAEYSWNWQRHETEAVEYRYPFCLTGPQLPDRFRVFGLELFFRNWHPIGNRAVNMALFFHRRRLLFRSLALFLLSLLPAASAAQDTATVPEAAPPTAKSLTSSLDFVPADTAFYFATSNHQQIWNSFFQSRAYAALKDTPAGRKMRKAYRKGLSRGWEQFGENPFRYYLEGYANSIDSVQGKLVMPYLERLFAHELFLYGDSRIVPFIQSLEAYYDEFQSAVLNSAEEGNPEDLWKTIETIGNKHLSGVEIPTFVVGAITDEPEVFVGFLELMNTGFQQIVRENPSEMQPLAKAIRFQSEGTGPADRFAWLGIEIVGDEIPFERLTENDPEIGPVLGILKPFFSGKRFAFAFAVRGQAVLMTFGPSFDHLRKLGAGPLLIDAPQLEQLRAARTSGQPICLAGYRSTEFARMTSFTWSGWARTASYFLNQAIAGAESELLSEAEKLELMKNFEAESEQCARELEALESKPGASLAYGLLTGNGIEGFSIEFDQPAESQHSQPLQLPNQLSSPPLLAVFNRNQAGAEHWKIMGRYLGKLFSGLEHYGPLLAEDLERAEIAAIVLERLAPLLQSLSQATLGELLPEMAGREWGLVVDFSLTRNRWHREMPSANDPLPMPGAVMLMQFQNAAVAQQVGAVYLSAARKLLQDVKEFSSGNIPNSLEIPDPKKQSLPFGEAYSFPLSTAFGLTPDWSLHAVINEKLIAIGYFPEQTARLLQPLSERGRNQNANSDSARNSWLFGPAGENASPTSGLLCFDNRQLADAVEAWLNYGLEQAKADGQSLDMAIAAETEDLNLTEEELRETLAVAFKFYRTFAGFSSRSYRQENTSVRHFLLKFSDK